MNSLNGLPVDLESGLDSDGVVPQPKPGDVLIVEDQRMTYVGNDDKGNVVLVGEEPKNKHLETPERRLAPVDFRQAIVRGRIRILTKPLAQPKPQVNGNLKD